MAQLAVVLLALFAQMERTYTLERAAHARAVATAKGRRTGRPSVVSESQLVHAIQLRRDGHTVAEITAATGLTRSTLYRHLPARRRRGRQAVTRSACQPAGVPRLRASARQPRRGPLSPRRDSDLVAAPGR